MNNFWLKAASVLLALTLWVFVMSKGRTEVLMEVPLMFRDVPAGLQVKDADNMSVTVHLRGDETSVTTVKRSDVKAYVTLSDAKSGLNLFSITPADIKVPSAVKVITVNPSSIKVELETVEKRTVTVVPVITGEPSPGYVVKGAVVTPLSLEIEGPTVEVKKIRELKTKSVDVSLASGTIAERVAIDTAGHNVKVSASSVRVVVRIEKKGGGR